ncbi:MAG TPA: ATP-binding protein [Solirubrobacteraceae bacterium]|nr:ATP-binding protein [Solirubrobacteraceae bacterium]
MSISSDDDVDEARRAVEARAAVLDEQGLTAGLHALARDVGWPGMDVDFRVDLAFDTGRHPHRLLPDIEHAVFWIVQEALDNAGDHARARQATVTVEETADALAVEIADDGAGFDPAAVTPGSGLVGMEERARLLDGTLEVRSAAGEGTRIRVTLPARHREAPASP